MRRNPCFLIACLLFVPLLARCKAPADSLSEPAVRDVWEPGKSYSTTVLPQVRGMRDYRGVIHLHSHLSHDACDGHDKDLTDEQCLADLRAAICKTGQDFVYLTDHPAFFRDNEFPTVLLFQPGDVLIERKGKPVANQIQCEGGHSVLLQAGFESSRLMPVGFYEHAGTTPAERAANYDGFDAAAIERLQTAGAAIYLPHTESKDYAWYSKLPIEAQEIYNIHANLDPNIRRDFLGLDEASYLGTLLKFMNLAEDGPHPDLSFLAFFEANQVDLDMWDRILQEKKVAGIAGADAHQNVFVNKMRDGERGDGYRRILGFYSNHILSADPMDLDIPKKAIRALRGYVAFEAFGLPAGFDFHAEAGGAIYEMGDDVPSTEETQLVLIPPQVHGLSAAAEKPVVTGILYRVHAGRREIVAQGPGELRVANPGPGVYRAEIRIVPAHLKGYLGTLEDALMHEYPWVYSNPVFLRAE